MHGSSMFKNLPEKMAWRMAQRQSRLHVHPTANLRVRSRPKGVLPRSVVPLEGVRRALSLAAQPSAVVFVLVQRGSHHDARS